MTNKELGQYPAILTSHMVNNPYLSTCKFSFNFYGSYMIMAEPMKTLELRYPMMQFLIIPFLSLGLVKFTFRVNQSAHGLNHFQIRA